MLTPEMPFFHRFHRHLSLPSPSPKAGFFFFTQRSTLEILGAGGRQSPRRGIEIRAHRLNHRSCQRWTATLPANDICYLENRKFRMEPKSNCPIHRLVVLFRHVWQRTLGRKTVSLAQTSIRAQSSSAREIRDVKTLTTTEMIRVAIIEDDQRLRQALIFQLRTAGFEATPYRCAEELLEAADASKFDCVLTDVYLPRMNGLQLQEELIRTVGYASIVFITGHGDLS